ncbi:MAG: twin-arginine translocation signal domain-containing protein, partial [Rudaea sp.]
MWREGMNFSAVVATTNDAATPSPPNPALEGVGSGAKARHAAERRDFLKTGATLSAGLVVAC